MVDKTVSSYLAGDKVKDLLIRSKLPGGDLMQIWYVNVQSGSDRPLLIS